VGLSDFDNQVWGINAHRNEATSGISLDIEDQQSECLMVLCFFFLINFLNKMSWLIMVSTLWELSSWVDQGYNGLEFRT